MASTARVRALGVGLALLAAALVASEAAAQTLPPVNLGFTSFMDGGPPAGPGFYYQQYLQYYTADNFKDSKGNDVPLPAEPDIEVLVSLNQFIYQSDQEIPCTFGGKWGIDVIVPVVVTSIEPNSLPVKDGGAGIGDLLIGPYLQWDPIMGENGPIFMHRIEFQNILPTGKYDDDHVINPGSNFYSFNPYWAATWFVTPQWTVTWRFHYLWNDENENPIIALSPPGATGIQSGQAVHLNFASSIEVLPKQLRVGINGYWLEQITDDKMNGGGMVGSREQVIGVGPGLMWSFSQNDHLFFNAYFELEAENRPQGNRFTFRWTHHF